MSCNPMPTTGESPYLGFILGAEILVQEQVRSTDGQVWNEWPQARSFPCASGGGILLRDVSRK